MRSRIGWIVVVAIALASSSVLAGQEVKIPAPVPAKVAELAAALGEAPKVEPPPVVSELVALKLDRFLAEMDKRNLQIALAQAELAKFQTDAQAYALTLQRPGYTLARGQNGQWLYAKQEPPKVEPSKPDTPKPAPAVMPKPAEKKK